MKPIVAVGVVTFIACLSVAHGAFQVTMFGKADQQDCHLQFAANQVEGTGLGLQLPRLACASCCAQSVACRVFRHSTDGDRKVCCELDTNVTTPGQGVHSHSHRAATCLPLTRNATCYKRKVNGTGTTHAKGVAGNSWSPSFYEDDSDRLQNTSIVVYLDTDDPKTTIWTSMKTQSISGVHEGKAMFRDESTGTLYVLIIGKYSYTNRRTKFFMLSTVEIDDEGFVENASRILHMGKWDGRLVKAFVHPNGSTWVEETFLPRLRVFVQRPHKFSKKVSTKTSDLHMLLDNIEKGYEINDVRYCVIDPNRANVTLVNSNIILMQTTKSPLLPVKYEFEVGSFTDKARYHKEVATSGNVEKYKEISRPALRINPQWAPGNDQSLTTAQQLERLKLEMRQGHQFHVSFDNGHFDVDVVTRIGREVFFLLPHQLDTPSGRPADDGDFFGVRAVVSFHGRHSWCSHPLEVEDVLGRGSQDGGLRVGYHVDLKARTAALSVFSNGTLVFGSPSDLADAAHAGKDVNVLVEWLWKDAWKQFSVSMVTVKDYGFPNVVVSAVSRESWQLVGTVDEKVGVSEACHMERVLVKSNGLVQTLVYNVNTRQPVTLELDTRTTWFVSK